MGDRQVTDHNSNLPRLLLGVASDDFNLVPPTVFPPCKPVGTLTRSSEDYQRPSSDL